MHKTFSGWDPHPQSHAHHDPGQHRRRFGFEGFASEFWGPGRGRHGRGRGGRIFEQGDLKYVILRLLEERPRHGYDIIKGLEDRFGGTYSPSPGTVYPTLSMLEDLGFARALPEESGKKIYEITDEGRQHLAEHSDTVDDIFQRIAHFVQGFLDQPMMDINRAFKNLGRAAYGTASASMSDSERLKRIHEILEHATTEIEGLAGK